MAEKDLVFKQTLKHKGFFDYSELYSFCYGWLKDHKYSLSEDSYTEKVQSNGRDIEIEWSAKKKVSDYFKEELSVKFTFSGITDAEVMVEDQKVSTNKGSLKIAISATLVKDYDDQWSKTPFYKFLRGIYDKYIIRNTTDLYGGKLGDTAESLYNDIKAFLNLSVRN